MSARILLTAILLTLAFQGSSARGASLLHPPQPIGITISALSNIGFCPADQVMVTYVATGIFTTGNVFTAELSDPSGSFTAAVVIGTCTATTSGMISCIIPMNTPAGTGFRIRVTATQPAVQGSDNGADLTVYDMPSASITPMGSTTVCQGTGVLLQATPGAGFTYVWRRDGAPISGAMVQTYSATVSGSYTVDVINTSGCLATSPPVVVTVWPHPTASITPQGSTSFCDGGSVILLANTGGGFSHEWRRNGQPLGGGASWLATEAGVYTVVVSNPGGCFTTSPGVTVSVFPLDPTLLVWSGTVSGTWDDVGNWSSPCAIPSAGDSVIIGPGATPLTGIPPVTLAFLGLSSGTDIPLLGDVTITTGMTLQAGRLLLNSFHVQINGNAFITGGSAGSHLLCNGSGTLRQLEIGTGGRTGAITFPVGIASSYLPVSLSNAGTADEFAVRVSAGVLSGGDSGAPLATHVVHATWHITEAQPGGSTAVLGFQWNRLDESATFDRTQCLVARHDGVTWAPLQSAAGAGGPGPYVRQVTGVTEFSHFAIGDSSSSLPVELRSFTVRDLGASVLLDWTVERETSLHRYIIDRRVSGGMWSSRGTVAAIGLDRYVFTDAAAPGDADYRLLAVDVDGTDQVAAVVHFTRMPSAERLSLGVHPNPGATGTRAWLTLENPAGLPTRITLHDELGREIALVAQTDAQQGLFPLPTTLPAGCFFIHARNALGVTLHRVSVVH